MRKRRIIKWATVALTTLIAIGLVVSMFLNLRWPGSTSSLAAGISNGVGWVSWLPDADKPKTIVLGTGVVAQQVAGQMNIDVNCSASPWLHGQIWPRLDTMQPFGQKLLEIPLVLPLAILFAFTLLLWFAGRRRYPAGTCPNCGYNLTGNVTGRCPECGEPIEAHT